ncbi:MAG TPA: hypothetical protein VHW00_02480 [Thermoanaerobaculia bacterium]|nr:hypothetical protein [Thermoanaerobaculia bacterium]
MLSGDPDASSAVLVAGAATPRWTVTPDQDDEIVLATAIGPGGSIAFLADEERGMKEGTVQQTAGLAWVMNAGPPHADDLITSTDGPLDPAQKRPPFRLGTPKFAVIAATGAGFLALARELAGAANVFAAELTADGRLAGARYIPELSEELIGANARLLPDGAGGAWLLYAHSRSLRAARVSSSGVVITPFRLASIDGESEDERMFDAAVRADGQLSIAWIDDASLRFGLLAADGMFTSIPLAAPIHIREAPLLANANGENAVVWLDRTSRSAHLAIWDERGECVLPPHKLGIECKRPRDLRIGALQSQFVLGWRCADNDMAHAAWLERAHVVPVMNVDATGRYFDLGCSGIACAMWWQERPGDALPGPWLWQRSLRKNAAE